MHGNHFKTLDWPEAATRGEPGPETGTTQIYCGATINTSASGR